MLWVPVTRSQASFPGGLGRSSCVPGVYQLIVWKLIEIMGEALRQGEEQEPMLRALIPELREVINTRNRIVHGYASVDFQLRWDIATNEVPTLRKRMASLLEDDTLAEG